MRNKAQRGKTQYAAKGGRRRPYVFRFKAPDKTFNLSLTFRQSTVDKADLVRALEQILKQLKSEKT